MMILGGLLRHHGIMPQSPATTPPSRSNRWRATFFAEPDPALREAFFQEIAWDNLQRVRWLNYLAIFLSALMLAVQDFLLWRSGAWDLNPALQEWVLLHAAMLVLALCCALLWRVRKRAGPADVKQADHYLTHAVIGVFLLLLLLNTFVQQRITGQITTTLLGIGVYASCIYSSSRMGLTIIGGTAAILVLAMPFFQTDPVIVSNHSVVTAVFATIFWFVSRLIYSLRAHDFNQLNTIAMQARSLEEANSDLRKANALKSELAGIAAHDLRDPLNAISGLAQELKTELPDNGAAQDLVDGIGESARRMSHVIENLLTNAENDTRGLNLEVEPTDLRTLIEDAVADYRWLAGSKGLVLHCAMPQDDPIIVDVDPRKLRQLLENLLSNAIKYSPPQRSVHVRLQSRVSHGARIEVQDEGVGLLEEDKQRLFGKFERLSSRPTSGEATTGLGLAIVRAIAQAHGGQVWAESAGRNQGTTFVVELP